MSETGYLARLLDALPSGVLVIDGGGNVTYASTEAAALVERPTDELVGRSVLEFVDAETAWAYAAALAMAGDFSDVVVGPMRVTVVGASGRTRAADLWSLNHLDDPVIEGIVCVLTPATAAVGLGEAVSGLAADAEFTTVAARVTRAMDGHPTTARAVLLAAGPSGFRIVGDPSDDGLPDMTGDGPWVEAVASGVRQLAETLDEVPADLAEAARAAGFATVWAEPVGRGELPARGALVLWRRLPGRPTPNELNVMHQGAAILAVAWDRHEQTA